MTVAERIKHKRKQLGISVDELATKLGKNRATVYRYESGEIESLPTDILGPIAKALKTTPAYLMGWENENGETDLVLLAIALRNSMGIPYEDALRKAAELSTMSSGPKGEASSILGRRIPILGSIAAGLPLLAAENIEGYDYADVPEGQEYFFLRVKGDSMVNARINDGDLVLVKKQTCADDGQIVVCLLNGDEATLKRYYRRGDTVILQPENSSYQPFLVPCNEFDTGYAKILGVAVEVKIKL